MDAQPLRIVCYTGGTCGDLISGLIDNTGVKFNTNIKTVVHIPERTYLKKPHLFATDAEKDNYITDVSKKYYSISSHDLDYHIQSQHNFIGIIVNDFSVALWAAERFRRCHRPHVWEEMKHICGARDVKDYAQILLEFSKKVVQHTDKVLQLEEIYNGTVLPSLENILGHPISKNSKHFYQEWLDLQRGTF